MIQTTLVTTFSTAMINEASSKQRDLINMGEQKEALSMKQREILIWFSQDDERVRCLGYTDFYEMIRDPEIASALWGREVVGNATRNRLVRLVDLQLLVPEIDLFSELPRSVTSSPAMPVLENAVALLPPPSDPSRAKELGRLRSQITEIQNTHWRDHNKNRQSTIQSEYTFDSRRKTIFDSKGNPVVVFDEITPLVARALVMIFHDKWDSATIDADSVTAWVNDKPVKLGRVVTKDKRHINMLVDMLHASR